MWRKRLDISQEDLAAAAGLGYSHLNELENGKTDPGLTTILRISKALGVNPVVFFLKRSQAEMAQELWGYEAYPEPEIPAD